MGGPRRWSESLGEENYNLRYRNWNPKPPSSWTVPYTNYATPAPLTKKEGQSKFKTSTFEIKPKYSTAEL